MVAIPPPPMPTVEAIYRHYESKSNDGYRDHLGASLISGACDRAKWYTWRWMSRAIYAGRLLRLFETGNLAEERFVNNLRAIGVTVMDVDPETGKQWTVRDGTGHFGGSLDGVCIGLLEAPKTWHGLEFKTHSEKSFNKLKKEGVKLSKPEHWGQMQTYMHLAQLTRFLYLAVNKNTDELYQERISYDAEEGIRIVAHAGRIIRSTVPPGRISEDSTWFQCRMCQHHGVCHSGNLPERHCRSCMHSTPVADGDAAGTWRCELHGWKLNGRMQRHGCGNGHKYIPALIPGEQIDAAENASWIDYRMGDGRVWRDSGKD